MTIYTLSHGPLKLDVSDQGGVIEADALAAFQRVVHIGKIAVELAGLGVVGFIIIVGDALGDIGINRLDFFQIRVGAHTQVV